MISDPSSKIDYSVLDLGFSKSLIKGLVTQTSQNQYTPEMQNAITSGVAPKNLLSGELISDLEQHAGVVWNGKEAFNNDVSGYRLGVDTDGISKFFIGTTSDYFNFDGTNVIISGALSAGSIDIGGADATSFHVDANGNIWLGNATFSGAPFSVSNAGAMIAESGTIAGWIIGATTLSATGIILDSANQKIYSSNYTSGVAGAGFYLDSNLLEVGNIAARGMIRTAVFEKDTVSTVGGNLLVRKGYVLNTDMTALDNSVFNFDYTGVIPFGNIFRIKDGVDDEWMQVSELLTTGSSILIDSFTTYDSVVTFYDDSKKSGQSFTVGSQYINHILSSVKFALSRTGNPTGYLEAKLYTHSGVYGTSSVPGTLLATSDAINCSSINNVSITLHEFFFTGINKILLSPNTYYCISLELTGSGDQFVNHINMFYDYGTPTHSGNQYINYLEIYYPYSPDDFVFYLYVEELTGEYLYTRDKASVYTSDQNPVWKKGATIVDYGLSGDGGIYMTASDANAPYLSIFDHAGSPWSTINTRLRIGNLNGYLGYTTDTYGIAIGDTDNFLKYDSVNGLRISGNIAASTIDIGGADASSFHVDVDGNIWSGAATFATAPFKVSNEGVLSAIGVNLAVRASTVFETTTRFTSSVGGSGSTAFGVKGCVLATGATSGSFASLKFVPVAGYPAFGTSTIGISIGLHENTSTVSGSGELFVGYSTPPLTISGASITYDGVCGFKVIKTGGVTTLYAVQSQGDYTETVSSALTTLSAEDTLELIFRYKYFSKTEFFWRKNSGNLSSVTTITHDFEDDMQLFFATTNKNTAYKFDFYLTAATYER